MKTSLNQIFWAVIMSIVVMIGLYFAATTGLDKSIDNQNTMLCNDAQRSGNKVYLSACEPYYETGDITYMREGK